MDDRTEWLLKLLSEERQDVLRLLDLKHTTLIAAFKEHLTQEVALHPPEVAREGVLLGSPVSAPCTVEERQQKVSEIVENPQTSDNGESMGKRIMNPRHSNDRSEDELLTSFFEAVDSNGNGEISIDEVRAALERVGQRPAQARRLVAEMRAVCKQVKGHEWQGRITRDDWDYVVQSHSLIREEICEIAEKLQSPKVKDKVSRKKRSRYCLLSAYSHQRVVWNVVCSICVVYVMIFVPYWLGFDGENVPVIVPVESRSVIGKIIDIVFLFDIVLSFRTTYYSYGEEVRNWRKITLKYMSSWFLIDAISSVPVSFLNVSESETYSFKFVKFGRILVMLKVIRSAKAFRVLSRSNVGEFVEEIVVELGLQMPMKLFLIIAVLFFCCHWLACAMAAFGTDIVNQVRGTGSLYLPFFYWALTTVTTVGYGDLVPKSESERVIAMVAMCVGGTLYGLFSGIVTSTIVAHNRSELERLSKMDLVNNWLRRYPFPLALKRRLRHYFKSYLSHEMNLTKEELDMFEGLTLDLRLEVAHILVPEEVHELPIFKCVPRTILGFIVSTLQFVAFGKKQPVVKAGECGVAMFVIMEGHCLKTASTNLTDVNSTDTTIADLFIGDSFGEEIILDLEDEFRYTVVAQEESNLCSIAENLFMRFMTTLPQHLETMRECFEKTRQCEAGANRPQCLVVTPTIEGGLNRHAL